MRSISYETAKRELAAVFDRVWRDREPILIECDGANVVVLAQDDFTSLEETAITGLVPAIVGSEHDAMARLPPEGGK